MNIVTQTFVETTKKLTSFDVFKARKAWENPTVNLLEIEWKKEPASFSPEHLASIEKIYSAGVKIDLSNADQEIYKQIRAALGNKEAQSSLSDLSIDELAQEQLLLTKNFAEMVQSQHLCCDIWTVPPTTQRKPDAGDFIHLDGILVESKLRKNSPILLRTYGEPMQYVLTENIVVEKFEDFYRFLTSSMRGEKQVISDDITELQDPNGEYALSILKPGAKFLSIEAGNVLLFRTGRENGLYHRAPWPAGWRLNFRLSVPN